jgi:hypothetical protein
MLMDVSSLETKWRLMLRLASANFFSMDLVTEASMPVSISMRKDEREEEVERVTKLVVVDVPEELKA